MPERVTTLTGRTNKRSRRDIELEAAEMAAKEARVANLGTRIVEAIETHLRRCQLRAAMLRGNRLQKNEVAADLIRRADFCQEEESDAAPFLSFVADLVMKGKDVDVDDINDAIFASKYAQKHYHD